MLTTPSLFYQRRKYCQSLRLSKSIFPPFALASTQVPLSILHAPVAIRPGTSVEQAPRHVSPFSTRTGYSFISVSIAGMDARFSGRKEVVFRPAAGPLCATRIPGGEVRAENYSTGRPVYSQTAAWSAEFHFGLSAGDSSPETHSGKRVCLFEPPR